ncbi:carboxymuconolactone decarboxylase family protein [Paracraurococcus lichenis]|uniref:Carboxymuconolactone decarboxylase family protein n=1 Tax=Paracraurococcus lichenis TaxID=3064888 RepID=A0ABT9EB34_9PROT|nr:carboxymuconolactone decarboxylase family protein [Paracraurococcus sp. LOR1-02]MDO9713183.1 carboxymuconolactone decarboxylase family protein [Paracraurococcus sp. LOR1-02]
MTRAATAQGGDQQRKLVEYNEASPEVRVVFDDIMAARGMSDVGNLWKALAIHPPTLARTWAGVREVMRPGALDPLTKELLYLVASMVAGCTYCTATHTAFARARGMTEEMYGELLAIVGMAAETNRFAEVLQVPIETAAR